MTPRQIDRTTRGRSRPRQTTPITNQDRDEAAAIAGAKAEAKGLPRTANPYRQTPPLRFAWASGWQLSRQDRDRA